MFYTYSVSVHYACTLTGTDSCLCVCVFHIPYMITRCYFCICLSGDQHPLELQRYVVCVAIHVCYGTLTTVVECTVLYILEHRLYLGLA